MKKRRFQINGDFYDVPDAEVSAFVADNPDAQEVRNYKIKGSEYNIPLNEVASFEADMGFDDHTQKANFEKKNGNGSSNGHEQPVQEPAATTLPSPEESEPEPEQPKVSVFDNPKLDALGAFGQDDGGPISKRGFDVNIPSAPEQPKTLAPKDAVPAPAPLKTLYQDYQDHKPDIDRAMTTTVEGNPEFGHYVPNDSLFNAAIDPRNPSVTLLNKYSQKRAKDLDAERQERTAVLDKKYPYEQKPVVGNWRPPEYYTELDALNKEMAAKKAQIEATVFDVARTKKLNDDLAKVAKPKFVMKDWGRYMRSAAADPTLAKEERYEQKGVPLSPAENYYNDKLGYTAMASALNDLDKKGVDIAGNPAARELYGKVKEGKNKLLSDHKDFAKQQAARLISNEIFRDKNWFQTMFGAYTVNDADIQKAAKKLGLPDDIAKLVHEDDIQTSNMFGEFANELAARPGANIGTFIGRPFRREVLGQDPDAIDYHYEQLNKKYTTFLANSPDAEALFGLPTEVAGDPTQDNFLEDVQSAKKGKFNWSVSAIANTIGNGTGQMIQYGLGGNATGGALRGINKLIGVASDVEKAKNVGLVTYGFLNSYEQGYQQARQLVGDDPAKEGQRNVVAALQAGVQAFSELIFPDYKVTDKLFSVKNPGARQLLQLLSKAKAEDAAKVLTSAVGKKTLVAAIKEGVVNTAKDTVKEIAEEEAGLLGDVVISAVTNKKSLDDRNIFNEAIETAVQTGLSAAVPIGAGEFRHGNRASPIKKAMVYEMGSDPQTVLSHINKEEADGKISTKVANRKGSIVNTMADIVKSTPDVSPLNGNNLTEKDKQDYAYNMLHSTMLGEKAAHEEKIGDVIQAAITKKQIKELADERELILAAADGIERNMNGQPLYERDNKAGMALKKAVELLPKNEDRIQLEKDKASENRGFDRKIAALDPDSPTYEVEKNAIEKEREEANEHYDGEMAKATDNPALMGMDNEAAIKYIAQQAQNVQVDGSLSDRQTFDDAYKAAVKAFGQPLVDAAIAAHPVENLLAKPVTESAEDVKKTDFTGKDNNFLANEEGFFTPDERVQYFELMKDDKTKDQAAQMVKDRKEQIEKFATPKEKPAEIIPEEKKEEKKEPEPEGKFRSQKEAEDLMSDNLIENGEPVHIKDAKGNVTEGIEQKMLFKQKFGKDVTVTDVATGKEITDKAHKVKKILTDDFNAVNAFINC